jgi:hypothetical protein
MFVESIVVLTTYWPQSIAVSDPVHTDNVTSWTVTSNNAVNISFDKDVTGLKLSGYGSIYNERIMPNDNGVFKVQINKDQGVILSVIGDEV